MNCQDIPVPGDCLMTPPNPVDMVEAWRTSARAGKLKINGKLLSVDECRVVEEVLSLILADLVML